MDIKVYKKYIKRIDMPYNRSMDGKIEEEPYMALSIKEIARLIKCAESTANRVIKKLVDKGYLERVKRGQGNPNIYIFKGWRKWQ